MEKLENIWVVEVSKFSCEVPDSFVPLVSLELWYWGGTGKTFPLIALVSTKSC